VLTPRVPEGWRTTPASASYALAPGRSERFLFDVQIPETAKPEIYSAGGQTRFSGTKVSEIHSSRVKVIAN
jgi:hypothetical protein